MRVLDRWFVGTGLLACGALLVPVLGCSSAKRSMQSQIDQDPKIRESAIEGARKSCIQTADDKLHGHPEFQPKIVNYCDCFATQGMGKFSNSEIVSIGVKGIKSLTPEQNRKLTDAIQRCEQQAGIQ